MIKYQKPSRFFYLLLLSFYGFSETIVISPSEDPYTEIQEALILANSGDIIRITEGLYELEDSLSIDVDGLILEGEGINKTIDWFIENYDTNKIRL